MNRSKEFEQSVLIELLTLAINNKALLTKECESLNGKGCRVFTIDVRSGWNNRVAERKIDYGFFDDNEKYPGGDIVYFMQKKFKLFDRCSRSETYNPTHLTINFEDQPALEVVYKAEEKKLPPTTEIYKVRTKWYKKPISIKVVKNEIEYIHSYEIKHGTAQATISEEKYDEIIATLKWNIKNMCIKQDLDKAIERVHQLKKND